MKISKLLEIYSFLEDKKIIILKEYFNIILNFSDEQIDYMKDIIEKDDNVNIINLINLINNPIYYSLKDINIKSVIDIINSNNFNFIIKNYGIINKLKLEEYDNNNSNFSIRKYPGLNIVLSLLIESSNPKETLLLAIKMERINCVNIELLSKISKVRSNELTKAYCNKYKNKKYVLEKKLEVDTFLLLSKFNDKEIASKLLFYVDKELDLEDIKKLINHDNNTKLLIRILKKYKIDSNNIDDIINFDLKDNNLNAINNLIDYMEHINVLFQDADTLIEILNFLNDVSKPELWDTILEELIILSANIKNINLFQLDNFIKIDNHKNFNKDTVKMVISMLSNNDVEDEAKLCNEILKVLDNYTNYEKFNMTLGNNEQKMVDSLKKYMEHFGDVELNSNLYIDKDILANVKSKDEMIKDKK